jgi:ribosomal protein L35
MASRRSEREPLTPQSAGSPGGASGQRGNGQSGHGDESDEDAYSGTPGGPNHDEQKGSAEKRFTCPECGVKFSRKHNMQAHLLTHSGKKTFKCDRCEVGVRSKAFEVHN